ncbi:hypothetical protein Tco_0773595 [Tanacetum coccineum]|uniref:Uncharacterized protein n=1 Tax=Tanacetum coccineum TaxID=301880 RepID=A0ABQ4ZLB2_9ASTR
MCLVEAEAVVAALPTGVLHPTLVSDTESEPFEDPPSPVDAPVSDTNTEPLDSPGASDYFPRSDTESDPEESSEEDPSGDDSPPAQIVPASPRIPAILVQPRQAIPFDFRVLLIKFKKVVIITAFSITFCR